MTYAIKVLRMQSDTLQADIKAAKEDLEIIQNPSLRAVRFAEIERAELRIAELLYAIEKLTT